MKRIGDNILSNKFLVMDIETTGLDENSKTAGIVEVYAGIMENGRITTIYNDVYFHENYKDTWDFHRITEEEIMGKPVFETQNHDILKNLLMRCCDPKSDYVLMAYYAPFEIKWLSKFLNLNLTNIKVCDPRDIYCLLDENVSHKLVDAAKDLCGITPTSGWAFHRAKDDSTVMTKVFRELVNRTPSDLLEDYIPGEYFYDISSKLHD